MVVKMGNTDRANIFALKEYHFLNNWIIFSQKLFTNGNQGQQKWTKLKKF